MAIKIEIEAASAAEMHEELKTLLFGTAGPTLKTAGPLDLPKAEPGKVIEIEAEADDPEPAKEAPKKKRRTKAEIEADKAAVETEKTAKDNLGVEIGKNTVPERDTSPSEPAPEMHEGPEETLNVSATNEKSGKRYGIDDLRQLAMSKGMPKKPAIANILNTYGVKTFPQLSEDQMQEVYAKIEKL